MPSAFSETSFDVESYFRSRPRYPSRLYDALLAYHSQGSNHRDVALDIGCGPGIGTYPLVDQGFRFIYGIDPSEPMLRTARSLFSSASSALGVRSPISQNGSEGAQLKFLEGSGEQTNLPDASVDFIFGGVSVHWMDWRSSTIDQPWRELARILRPGGSVAFIGYMSGIFAGKPLLSKLAYDSFYRDDRLGVYFNREPLSSHDICTKFYDTLPPPPSELFDASATRLFKLEVDPTIYNTTPSEPIPSWFQQAMWPSSETNVAADTPMQTPLRMRMTLRTYTDIFRSASGYVKYLSTRPEERDAISRNEDKMAQWIDEARWAQARSDVRAEALAVGQDADAAASDDAAVRAKLIDWDDEYEVYYPIAVYLARRAA